MNKVKNILTRYSLEKEDSVNRVNKENYEKDKIKREALERKEKVKQILQSVANNYFDFLFKDFKEFKKNALHELSIVEAIIGNEEERSSIDEGYFKIHKTNLIRMAKVRFGIESPGYEEIYSLYIKLDFKNDDELIKKYKSNLSLQNLCKIFNLKYVLDHISKSWKGRSLIYESLLYREFSHDKYDYFLEKYIFEIQRGIDKHKDKLRILERNPNLIDKFFGSLGKILLWIVGCGIFLWIASFLPPIFWIIFLAVSLAMLFFTNR
jgi:hypothetical protein